MSLRKRIIINAGSNWANMLVVAVVGVILVPVMLSRLGVKAYGVWALLAYGLSYPMMLESAFALAINRFVAFYRKDTDKLNCFVSASFLILIALALITVLATIVLSFFIADIFKSITSQYAGAAQIACILVGITLACKIIEATFSGALRGCQYYARCNGIIIVANLLRLSFTVILLFVWPSIVAAQLAFALAALTSVPLMFLVAKKTINGFKIDFHLVTKDTVLELWRYTYHSIARSGSVIVMQNTLMLLVGWRGTATDVTIYTLAFKLPGFVRGFFVGAQNVFLPAVTSLSANGQTNVINTVMKKGTRVSFSLTMMVSLILFVFAEEILLFWTRGEAPLGTVEVTRIILLSIVPGGIFEIWIPVLVGIGHLRWLSITAIATTIAAILIELILLQGFVVIPMAPALAMVVVLWVKTGFWLPLYGLYKLGIKPYEYFKDSLSQPLLASLVSIAVVLGLHSVMAKTNAHWFLVFMIISVVIMIIFMAISLRQETVELVAAVRRKFNCRLQNKNN